jgi:hypothetical protein
MAATDAKPVPQYAKPYQHNFAIRKNDGSLITTWEDMDSNVSKDNNNYAVCDNEATEIQTSGTGYLLLSADEMTASVVVVKVTVTNTDALPYVVTLYPEKAGDIRDAGLLLQTNVDGSDIGNGNPVTLEGGAGNDDAYNNQMFTIYHTNGHVSVRNVTDWDGTDKEITLDEAIEYYASGDLVLITSSGKADAADIVDGVFDEAAAGHTAAGSFGKAISDTLADTNELQTDWADGGRLDLLLDDVPTINTDAWYVSKTGNDGNGGHSWTDAKLTVAATVGTATAGDTIEIGPGEYDEAVDASAKASLMFRGCGLGTHITNAGTPLTIGDYTIVENMRLTNSGATSSKYGLGCGSTTGSRIRDCYISGKYDGLNGWLAADLIIERCIIHGIFDAVNLYAAPNWIMNDCILETDCTWTAGATNDRALITGESAGIANRCMFIAKRNDTTAYETYAVYLAGGGGDLGDYIFNDCLYYVVQDNAGGTGLVAGIGNDHADNSVSINGGTVFTKQDGSGADYSLDAIASALTTVSPATYYDEAKTNGTITKVAAETDAASRTASKATGFSTHDAAAVKTALEADGSKLDHIWETTEDDGGTRRFSENSLETAPSGTGSTPAALWAYASRTLTGSGTVTVTSAVSDDNDIEIVQYDDYLTAYSRQLSWTNSGGDWMGGDLTDATVAFTATEKDGTAIITKAGAVVTATGTQAVSVDLTAAETALFTKPGKQYMYQLLITKATYRETEITGDITVTITNNEPA